VLAQYKPPYKAQFTNTRLRPCYAMTVSFPANSHGRQCAPYVLRARRVAGNSVSRTQSTVKFQVVVEPVGESSVYAVPTESPQIAHTQPYLGSYLQDCVATVFQRRCDMALGNYFQNSPWRHGQNTEGTQTCTQ
jgi:hypothetical protein